MISTTNAATKAFFMEITQIFLWFKPIFTSLGMQHYDNFSANSRGMHEEGKGGRSYIKTLYKIIRIFKDDKNSFEEIISIRTTMYYLLTVHLEEEITF